MRSSLLIRGTWTVAVVPLVALVVPHGTLASAPQRVVVVVVDGPRDTEFLESPAQIPRIWSVLRPQGVVSHGWYNQGPTQTVSGHAMLGSGAYQNLPNSGTVRPTKPLLWEYLRDQRALPDSAALVVTGKDKLAVLSHSSAPGYGAPDSALLIGPLPTDAAVVAAFKTYAARHPPIISMLCLSDVDEVAHTGQWGAYLAAIRRADSLVVHTWEWLQQTPPFAGVTALVVAADHGRHDWDWTGHGCACHGCRHLPFVAVGPGFKRGVELWEPLMDIWDLAPTLGFLLGVTTPLAHGRVLWEVLQPDTVPPCPPVVSIQLASDLVRITWDPVTTDAAGNPEPWVRYRVYRGSPAWFAPSAETAISGLLAVTEFQDADTVVVVGGEAVCYRVEAVDPWQNRSTPSAPVGLQAVGIFHRRAHARHHAP